jgi:hypothetical protein
MLIGRFVRRRLRIAANSNRRWSTGRGTGPSRNIAHPASCARTRAHACGPRARAVLLPGAQARPGGQPALTEAAHERASGDQGMVMLIL